jgi:hypothetical protein
MTTQQPNSWKQNAFYSKHAMLEDTDIETHILLSQDKEINKGNKYFRKVPIVTQR